MSTSISTSGSTAGSTATLRAAFVPKSTAITHALFIIGGTAFIGGMAQIAIPVPGSPVPVTGQTLAVLLVGTTYGARLALATFATYLLAAIAGAPLFAPSATTPNHGIERLLSATGGYLVGMLIAAFLLGVLADRRASLQPALDPLQPLQRGGAVVQALGHFVPLDWMNACFRISADCAPSAPATWAM